MVSWVRFFLCYSFSAHERGSILLKIGLIPHRSSFLSTFFFSLSMPPSVDHLELVFLASTITSGVRLGWVQTATPAPRPRPEAVEARRFAWFLPVADTAANHGAN